MKPLVETHPFPPVIVPHAKVMMMGSFPPTPEKRCMEFHYPNFQNDMWRIYGMVFFDDKEYFMTENRKAFDPEKIKTFMAQKSIALHSTVIKAIREQGNASDKFLTVVEPVNLDNVLPQVPECEWLFTTGGKATEVLIDLLPEKVKMPKTNQFIDFNYGDRALKLYRLPSTSRAYPLSLEKKAEAYRTFFKLAGII